MIWTFYYGGIYLSLNWNLPSGVNTPPGFWINFWLSHSVLALLKAIVLESVDWEIYVYVHRKWQVGSAHRMLSPPTHSLLRKQLSSFKHTQAFRHTSLHPHNIQCFTLVSLCGTKGQSMIHPKHSSGVIMVWMSKHRLSIKRKWPHNSTP